MIGRPSLLTSSSTRKIEIPMDPTLLTVAEASHAIAEGRLSPVELTDAYLDRIDALDGELHSYVLVLHDAARSAAREIAAGRSRGALHGIPIGLKDILKRAASARRQARRVTWITCRTRMRKAG